MPHSTSAPSVYASSANRGRMSFSRNQPAVIPSGDNTRRPGVGSTQTCGGAEHHRAWAAPPEGDVEAAIGDRHGLIQAPRRSAGSPTLAILNANNRIDLMARKPRWHGMTSATGLRPRVSPARAALRAPTRAATSRATLARGGHGASLQGFGPKCWRHRASRIAAIASLRGSAGPPTDPRT
jgi:hypothetical protein